MSVISAIYHITDNNLTVNRDSIYEAVYLPMVMSKHITGDDQKHIQLQPVAIDYKF